MKTIAFALFGVVFAVCSSGAAAGGVAPAEAAASTPTLSQAITSLRGNDGVSKVIQALTEDIPMTSAPAAYVLGVTGEQVPRYTTFRAFASGVERGVGKDGKLVNSVAAEIAPLLALKVLTLEDQIDWRTRALARTTFSVATTTASDNVSAKSAYGLHVVLYSRELDGAIDQAASAECRTVGRDFLNAQPDVGGSPGHELPPTPPALSPEQLKKVRDCQTAIDGILNRWNQTMIATGFGQAFKSADNTAATLKKASKVAWLTASYGFGSGSGSDANQRVGGLLTAHVRSERGGIADTPQAESPQMPEDADLVGLSLRGGKASFNALVEYSQRRSKVSGLDDELRRRLVFGFEYRIQKDLYISLGIGSENGRRDGKNSGMALANLKWGFGAEPILAP